MLRILSRLLLLSMCLLPIAPAAVDAKTTIIALSDSRMFWQDAAAYCQERGGRLPRINKSDSWDGSDTADIDAFGAVGDNWPADLPRAFYWTGTKYTANPDYVGYMWGVRVVRDLISVIAVKAQDTHIHVLCVE